MKQGLKIPMSLLLLILAVNSLPSVAQEYDWTATNVIVANQHIVPKYADLAVATDELQIQVGKTCAAVNELKEVTIPVATKASFQEVYLAWAQAQHFQFGPVTFLQRYERFHYWPDKHNVGARQLQQLLTEVAEGTVDVTSLTLAKKSVSVQGLSAMERLLFAPEATLDESRCFMAEQIAVNLQDIAEQIDSSWRLAPVEFAKEFELAGREQGTYGSSLDVSTMLANTLATQLLLIAEYKLGRALPKEAGGRVYQRQLEAWLSETSLEIIEQSLISLRELYLLAFSERTKQLNVDLHEEILTSFLAVMTSIDEFEQPLIATVVDEEKLPAVIDLQAEVMELETVIRSQLFPTLGFATRFNSLDGD